MTKILIEPKLIKKFVDISTIHYKNPTRNDMAICFVYFNFANSKRILMNYLYTVNKMKLANIPYFTLELVINTPDIKDAFHIYSSPASPLFHKEHLCNLLEKKIKKSYTKLLFLDCDIIFSDIMWYDKVSKELDSYQIVQPFSDAMFLDITYTKVIQEKLSVVFMDKSTVFNHKYHPGFGWAFQRKWFQKVGFYPYAITGCGDTLSVAAWLQVPLQTGYLQNAYEPSYNIYKMNAKGTISCVDSTIYHLWHGTDINRQWRERHKILEGITDVRHILKIENDKPFVLLNKEVENKLNTYFINRVDDSI